MPTECSENVKNACWCCGGGPGGFMSYPEREDNHASFCVTHNESMRAALADRPAVSAVRDARSAIMNDRRRDVLDLRHNHGYSVKLIADLVHASQATVRNDLWAMKREAANAG